MMDDRLFFYHHNFEPDDMYRFYGIYAPVLDRFILITTDLDIARCVAWLLMGKIHAVPIRLDKTENFTTDLIDNSVCTRWGITEPSVEFLTTKFLNEGNLYTHKQKIVDKDFEKDISINEMINEIQKFAFLGHYVKLFFVKARDGLYSTGYDIISAITTDPALNAIKDKERACYKIICLEENYHKAETEVFTILDKLTTEMLA